MMKYIVFAALLTGSAALVGQPKGKNAGQGQQFAMESCKRDKRVTQLKVEELNNRVLHLKSARPWMLVSSNSTQPKMQISKAAVALPRDLHVKRADAMCARAEVMTASGDVSKEQVLTLRKKCLESKIALAKAKKAGASSFIEGPISYRQKVHSNGIPTLEDVMAQEDKKKNEPINIKKVFYINMDKDADRKGSMERSLKAAGLEYERVSAVTTQEIAQMPKEKDMPRELWQFSNQGNSDYMKWFPEKARQVTQAIYLSQARTLKKISEQDNDSDDVYIIMEDDIILNPDWKETLIEKAKTLPKDWDVAKFVYWGMKRCEDKVPDSDWYEFRGPAMWTDKVNAMYSGNQAYMFRAKSIKNILEQLRGMPVMDVDGAMISNHQEKSEKIDGVDTPTVWGMHSYAIEWPLGKHAQAKRNSRWSSTEFSNPVIAGGAIARTLLR
jgi:GR25 family glycosyltransferase involved in LPS biosynthesis